MGKYFKKLNSLLVNHKEIVIILLILIVALLLRVYRIREFVIFLGDEGRDALVVKRMIVDHDLTLVGPTASVGGFYLGAVYYYFMVPFLWLFNFDPVGPAYMVALIGTATVALMYVAMRVWTNKSIAGITALIYATAPGIVSSSRSSWNPNIMPFFSLLSIFSLTLGLKKESKLWLILAGVSYGIAIQSHYLGLILGPILAISTFISLPKSKWLKAGLFELIGFALGASMYIAFEIKIRFINLQNVVEFASRGGSTTGPRSLNLIWLLVEMLRRTFESVLPQLLQFTKPITLISLFGLLLFLYQSKKKEGKLSIAMKAEMHLLFQERLHK